MPSKKSAEEPPPYVVDEKLSQAVDVLKKLTELRENESEKKPLIEDQTNFAINLQITFKKIPYNKTTFIHWLSLPHHWRQVCDFETCLIVKDLSKSPLTDRDLDLDQTKSHYKGLLSKHNCDQLVNEILPMRELRNEYKIFEAKQKLSKAFDVFLVDRSIMHNKFDYLPRFLGKTFWIDDKKVPNPIDLTKDDLKQEIENKLNQTPLYVSGKGDTSLLTIGTLNQSTKHLTDNLRTVLHNLKKLFGDNIRSLAVKTNKSMAITFFLDCGFITDTQLDKPTNVNEPIEDDFSHFVGSNVQIFKDGSVRVVPKPVDEIDANEEVDETETKWLSITRKQLKRKKKNNNNKRRFLSTKDKRFKRIKSGESGKQKVEIKSD